MKVVSLNIWDLPLWFVKNRPQRIGAVVDYLASQDPDIICLQESWDLTHRQQIYQKLGAAQYFSTALSSAKPKPFTMRGRTGGLVIFSKFPIVSETFITFQRKLYPPNEYFGHKGIVTAMLQTPAGPLQVINAHLVGGLGKSVWRQRLQQFKAALNPTDNNPTPTILAGDFNQHALTRHPEFAALLRQNGIVDPAPQTQPLLPTYRLDNPFVDLWINRRQQSERLDYIFVKFLEKLRLAVTSYAPMRLEPAISDHDPVVLLMSRQE
jgi:endonuclease/exonuclease/phosphatase family metal-dependent hydrolase